jgi:acyl carrier protein
MSQAAKQRIGSIFKKFIVDDDECSAVLGGEPILTVVSLDSLNMLKLITELEVEFGKRFDMETIEQTLESIDSLAAYLDP